MLKWRPPSGALILDPRFAKVNLILPGGNISGVKVVRSTPGLGMMKGYAWVCGNQYYTFLPPIYARY